MANISFFLTQEQFRNRTKTVTRRLGWKNVKVGQTICGIVKGQGLKPGEKIERLGQIRVVSVTREPLAALYFDPEYGKRECEKEGFPHLTGFDFAEMFCEHMKCYHHTEVTRIEFEYLDKP